jgi:hypoxanthine phosphoribosyltransferase
MIAIPELKILISKRKIAATVKTLAGEIQRDYEGKYPLLVGALKGSFVFMADLIRCLNMPLEVDFLRLATYGSGMESCGKVTLVHDLSVTCLQDRHVLIIEDIVDTGLTTSFIFEYLRRKGPASLKLCTLLDKPSRRKAPLTIDYLGITVPDKFIVGYGLDCGEKYRNLPEIYYIKEEM